jgi:hypothetical protein
MDIAMPGNLAFVLFFINMITQICQFLFLTYSDISVFEIDLI